MANKKITQLTAIVACALEDLFAVVDDPSGTPVTKKATLAQVLALAEKIANKDTANGYAGLDANGDVPLSRVFPASAASRLLGRGSAGGAGDWEEITVGTNLEMNSTSLRLVQASAESVLLGRGEGGGAGAFGEITLDATLAMTGGVLGVVDAGGGGGAWELVEGRAMTTNTQEDFINLADYNEIMVFYRAVTTAGGANLQLRVSTDNGSNYLSSSGDYIALAYDDPVGINKTEMLLNNAATTQGKNGFVTLSHFNNTTPKISRIGAFAAIGAAAAGCWVIPTTTALNAIRVLNSAASAMNGGTIYVFGRGA